MRVLAIDYGAARCGCAISDPTGELARPLPVIEPSQARAIADLAAEHDVGLVVVGMPVGLGGEEGPQAEVTRQFITELEGHLEVPVETYDERLTTRMAEQTARGGAGAAEDSIAAAHLLESYLASRREPEE